MITYSTCSPVIPDRARAALIASPPRSAALKSLSDPDRRPMGVRAPATITEVMRGPPKARLTTFATIPMSTERYSGGPHADPHRPHRDRLPRPGRDRGVLSQDLRIHRRSLRGERGAGR